MVPQLPKFTVQQFISGHICTLGCEARGVAYHQDNRLLVTTYPAAPIYVVKGHPVPHFTSPELPHLLLEKQSTSNNGSISSQ